jgi:hypothetical protein
MLEAAASANDPAPDLPSGRWAEYIRSRSHAKKCRAHQWQVESHACMDDSLDRVSVYV